MLIVVYFVSDGIVVFVYDCGVFGFEIVRNACSNIIIMYDSF